MAARRRGRAADDLDEAAPKPHNDAYTGLLAISLGAMIAGCALLYLDYSSYPTSKPKDIPKPLVLSPTAGGGGNVNNPPAGGP